VIQMLASEIGDNMLWIAMGSVGIVAILAGTISSVANTRVRERSRREIAAYIAEGSMTPEQGERLMKAAQPEDE
jgi:hypothetical protein